MKELSITLHFDVDEAMFDAEYPADEQMGDFAKEVVKDLTNLCANLYGRWMVVVDHEVKK